MTKLWNFFLDALTLVGLLLALVIPVIALFILWLVLGILF